VLWLVSDDGAEGFPRIRREGEHVLKARWHMVAGLPEEEGQALVEYSLILLLVALVTIAALTSIGTAVSGIIQSVAAAL
jgi:pilus assembly protein Flp/PilA